jgi:hypothetical protein
LEVYKKAWQGESSELEAPHKAKILTIAVHGKELPRYITRELKKILSEEQ